MESDGLEILLSCEILVLVDILPLPSTWQNCSCLLHFMPPLILMRIIID